jgi:hypothetical protein
VSEQRKPGDKEPPILLPSSDRVTRRSSAPLLSTGFATLSLVSSLASTARAAPPGNAPDKAVLIQNNANHTTITITLNA